MNGEILSGSSGETGPRSFQFLLRPSLMEPAFSGVVKLNRTGRELASCGQSVVVSLSRYIPRLSAQKTSLNFILREVACEDHAFLIVVALIYFARSALFVSTLVVDLFLKLRDCEHHDGRLDYLV